MEGRLVNIIRISGRSLKLLDLGFEASNTYSLENALRTVFPEVEFIPALQPFPSCEVVQRSSAEPSEFIFEFLFGSDPNHDGQTAAVVLSEVLPDCEVQLDLWMPNRLFGEFVRTVFVADEAVSEEVAEVALFGDDWFLTLTRWADAHWELDGDTVEDAVARDALLDSEQREHRRFARIHPWAFDGSGAPLHPRRPRCTGC